MVQISIRTRHGIRVAGSTRCTILLLAAGTSGFEHKSIMGKPKEANALPTSCTLALANELSPFSFVVVSSEKIANKDYRNQCKFPRHFATPRNDIGLGECAAYGLMA